MTTVMVIFMLLNNESSLSNLFLTRKGRIWYHTPINDNEIQRVESIKFLGVSLDEHLFWKEHIRYTENKVTKSIGLLYRTMSFLGKHSLLTLYFSYFHTYLNYLNLSWASTNRANLKKLQSQKNMRFELLIVKHTLSALKNFWTHRRYYPYISWIF